MVWIFNVKDEDSQVEPTFTTVGVVVGYNHSFPTSYEDVVNSIRIN